MRAFELRIERKRSWSDLNSALCASSWVERAFCSPTHCIAWLPVTSSSHRAGSFGAGAAWVTGGSVVMSTRRTRSRRIVDSRGRVGGGRSRALFQSDVGRAIHPRRARHTLPRAGVSDPGLGTGSPRAGYLICEHDLGTDLR